MFATGEEKSSTNRGIQKDIFFLFSKFEYILEHVDRRWRLFQKELDRRVSDDRLPVGGSHEVLDILCDRRHSQPILTCSLHETEEELRTIFVLHDIPGFVDNEHTLALTGSGNIPHVVEEDIHRDRTEYLIEITYREHHESSLEIDIGWLRERSCKYSKDVFFYTFSESLRTIHRLEH